MRVRFLATAARWGLAAGALFGLGAGCEHRDSANVGGAKWENPANWKQLRPTMSPEQVRGCLGEPTRVDANEAFTHWNYEAGRKQGRAVFAGGMLKDWTPPQ